MNKQMEDYISRAFKELKITGQNLHECVNILEDAGLWTDLEEVLLRALELAVKDVG